VEEQLILLLNTLIRNRLSRGCPPGIKVLRNSIYQIYLHKFFNIYPQKIFCNVRQKIFFELFEVWTNPLM
jgi:hypothetical protein